MENTDDDCHLSVICGDDVGGRADFASKKESERLYPTGASVMAVELQLDSAGKRRALSSLSACWQRVKWAHYSTANFA